MGPNDIEIISHFVKLFLRVLLHLASTLEEHSTHIPKLVGLNPTTHWYGKR
jgi:hypothetical protein